MMKNILKIGVILGSTILLSSLWMGLIRAQVQGHQWSAPHRLSSEDGNFINDSSTVIADKYGYVHVFWTEQSTSDARFTIQYARFDGGTWSTPLDIYISKPERMVDSIAVDIDQHGILHLIWAENGSAYYSSAPVNNALSAKYWSTPLLIDISVFQVKLKIDSKGVLHLVYADFFGEQPGIYHTHSNNQGTIWSDPVWIDPDIPPRYAPNWLQFELGKNDSLHIVWQYIDVSESGQPAKSVRYARSSASEQGWSLPITIDEEDQENGEVRAAGPLLATSNQSVMVIWAGTNQTNREFRLSTDGGLTWGLPIRIFGDLHGQAGDALAVDAAGGIHFIGQIRWPQGLYHITWDQNNWGTPSLFYLVAQEASEPIGSRIHVHGVEAAVRSGNQLVIIFNNAPDEPQLALYTMHVTLGDVQSLPPIPMPISSPAPVLQSNAGSMLPTPTPTRTVPKYNLSDTPAMVSETGTAGDGVWLGMLPSLILLVGVMAFRLLQRR